jgi:hypothetical protein
MDAGDADAVRRWLDAMWLANARHADNIDRSQRFMNAALAAPAERRGEG